MRLDLGFPQQDLVGGWPSPTRANWTWPAAAKSNRRRPNPVSRKKKQVKFLWPLGGGLVTGQRDNGVKGGWGGGASVAGEHGGGSREEEAARPRDGGDKGEGGRTAWSRWWAAAAAGLQPPVSEV